MPTNTAGNKLLLNDRSRSPAIKSTQLKLCHGVASSESAVTLITGSRRIMSEVDDSVRLLSKSLGISTYAPNNGDRFIMPTYRR